MTDKFEGLILMAKSQNSNPVSRKSSVIIQKLLDSRLITDRAHAYCQPNFCAFYGGQSWNCDGTRRGGQHRDTHTLWSNATRPAPPHQVCDIKAMEEANQNRRHNV